MKTKDFLKNVACKTRYLALLVLLTFAGVNAWADVLIIDGDNDDLTTTQASSATDYTYTADNSSSYIIKMLGAKYVALGSQASNNLSSGRAILIGKTGKYMYNTTAFGNKITGFKVYNNKGGSTNVSISVCFSSSSITSLCQSPAYSATLSTADAQYDLSTYLASTDKFFYLQVTNDYNAQIQVEVTFETCDKNVTMAEGTKSNVSTLTFSRAKVPTCSATAADRQVTVTITPADCYAVPSSTRLDVTGTSATYVSGPTDNGDGTYSFVYQYAQNATGTSTFAASLATKTTYAVTYATGSVPAGGSAITGSHAADTKTCGTTLKLPGVAFSTTGYTQTGWTKTDGGTQTNGLGGNYTSNSAQIFYPAWTANTCNVYWKVNNTDYSAGGSTTVTFNSRITTVPTPPDPASYCGDRFMGWTTDAVYNHGTSPLFTTAGSAPVSAGDQTFYAVFADYAE